jgi:glycosyltransferase involved in cell wall biosynthesis
MQNKKIAIIRTDCSPINLASYNCQEIGLAKALSKQAIDCDIYMGAQTSSVQLENVEHEGLGQIRVLWIPFKRSILTQQEIFPCLEKLIHKENYDLLQINELNEISTFYIALMAKKLKIDFLIYQGMYRTPSGRKNALIHQLLKLICYPTIKKHVKVIATKTSSAQSYINENGFENTRVFPVGLDDSKFKGFQKFDVKEKYKIPKNNKLLCYIGVFEARRNIDFLLKIAKELAHDSYTLILVGDGETKPLVQQIIKEEGLENVHLAGKVDQDLLPNFYQQSDLFLLASDYEIYGMVVLESLYFGCPVVSTQTAGPSDIIVDGKNGYLFDDMDIDNWTIKIKASVGRFDRASISSHCKESYLWDKLAFDYIEHFISEKTLDE